MLLKLIPKACASMFFKTENICHCGFNYLFFVSSILVNIYHFYLANHVISATVNISLNLRSFLALVSQYPK